MKCPICRKKEIYWPASMCDDCLQEIRVENRREAMEEEIAREQARNERRFGRA